MAETTTFHIRQGDTLPVLAATVQKADGTAMDLTTVDSVQFRMRTTGTREVLVDAAGAIVDAATGRISYTWAEGDTDRAGLHRAEFQLNYEELTMTVPNTADVDLLVDVMTQLG